MPKASSGARAEVAHLPVETGPDMYRHRAPMLLDPVVGMVTDAPQPPRSAALSASLRRQWTLVTSAHATSYPQFLRKRSNEIRPTFGASSIQSQTLTRRQRMSAWQRWPPGQSGRNTLTESKSSVSLDLADSCSLLCGAPGSLGRTTSLEDY